MEAVEKLLQVPVDYFQSLILIHLLKLLMGYGIEVDVPAEFTEQNSKDEPDAIHLKKDYKINRGRGTCIRANASY